MKKLARLGSLMALTMALLAASSNAFAQKNGGGGGGGGNSTGGSVETGVLFTFTDVASLGGKTATWSGNYTLTHASPGYYSWDTIQIALKGKSLNLPDGTLLRVTILFSDELSGQTFAPVVAPNIVCSGSTGIAKNVLTLANPNFTAVYRHLDEIVIQTPDGAVVAIAHG